MIENSEDTMRMSQVIGLLERIALALEKIAGDSAESPPREKTVTPFPWREVSNRVRHASMWACERWKREAQEEGKAVKYTWPLSCEDLMEVGCGRMRCIRGFGVASAEEIAAILKRLGFHDWDLTCE